MTNVESRVATGAAGEAVATTQQTQGRDEVMDVSNSVIEPIGVIFDDEEGDDDVWVGEQCVDKDAEESGRSSEDRGVANRALITQEDKERIVEFAAALPSSAAAAQQQVALKLQQREEVTAHSHAVTTLAAEGRGEAAATSSSAAAAAAAVVAAASEATQPVPAAEPRLAKSTGTRALGSDSQTWMTSTSRRLARGAQGVELESDESDESDSHQIDEPNERDEGGRLLGRASDDSDEVMGNG